MRASRIALALWLGIVIATATGCNKSKSSTPSCRNNGEVCAGASNCCSNACTGTCVDPGQCVAKGGSCNVDGDCCTNRCANQLCVDSNPCSSGGTDCCKALGVSCAADADCCNGHCDTAGTHVCYDPPPPPDCGHKGDSCTGPNDCCSQSCNLDAGSPGQCATDTFCVAGGDACVEGHACCSGKKCSAGTCPPGECLAVPSACADSSQCCSGNCSSGHCAPPAGGSCFTLYESCTLNSDCCSTNCKGPTGAKRCVPAYWCNAPGDICSGPKDCCTGLCGSTGRCESATGSGCREDGVPCSGASNCCTRMCVDPGSGVTVCQISGGCRMTGDYCDSTMACCGGSGSYDVYCDLDGTASDPSNKDNHVCSGGTSCNPPGNICGGSGDDHVPASQNCCHEGIASGKDVCKPDSNGIMRCYDICGGIINGCPYGCDGTPDCCIQPGEICNLTESCCNDLPCIRAPDGYLRCMNQCLSKGETCSTDGAPAGGVGTVHPGTDPCCSGSKCEWLGTEVLWRCAMDGCTKYLGDKTCTSDSECCTGKCDPSQGCKDCNLDNSCCKPLTQSCTADAECCSSQCDPTAHVCVPPCMDNGVSGCTADGDCCSGLTCSIPAGGTSGTCTTGGTCANNGQSCVTTDNCCPGLNLTCREGTCQVPPPTCPGPSGDCTTIPCCTTGYDPALKCHATDTTGHLKNCGAGDTACFCEQCALQYEACSTTSPCCAGTPVYCGNSSGACTPTNPAGCTGATCRPVGL